jgi:Arc/MetJ-type ribon-helix-helix transcriptional regulator/predicted transcriptional regulator
MKVVADIDPNDYDRIKELVAKGRYSDLEQFVRVAVDNQLGLEKDFDGTLDVENSIDWGYDVPQRIPVGQPYDIDRSEKLLFAQYYRFLPLKLVLIKLANMTADNNGPVRLENFRDYLKAEIRPIRDALVEWEERNDVKKYNKKSTSFPKRDVKNPEYSMKRFLNHYAGYIEKGNSEPHSMGNTLGFVSMNPTESDNCLVQLTPKGKEFLEMENPLLSEGPEKDTLSDEEKKFLIEHIRKNLETEYQFMEFIMETLRENNSESYTESVEEFAEYLGRIDDFGKSSSENKVRSHTAGAISRMVELGILQRGEKRGVYEPDKGLERQN